MAGGGGRLPMFVQSPGFGPRMRSSKSPAKNAEGSCILRNALQRVEVDDEARAIFREDAGAFVEDQVRLACRLALAEEQLLSAAQGLKQSLCDATRPGEGYRDPGVRRGVEDAREATQAVSAELATSLERLGHFQAECCNDVSVDMPGLGCSDASVDVPGLGGGSSPQPFGPLRAHLAAFHQDSAIERKDRAELRAQWTQFQQDMTARLQSMEQCFDQKACEAQIANEHAIHMIRDEVLQEMRIARDTQIAALERDQLAVLTKQLDALQRRIQEQVQNETERSFKDTFDAMRHSIQEQVQNDNVNAMRTIKSELLQEVRCGCDTQLAALEQTHHELSIKTFDSLRGRIQEQIQNELNGRCNDTFDAMRHSIQEQVQNDNVNAMRTIKSELLQEVRCGCDTQLAALEQTHHEFSIKTFDSLRGRIQEQIQNELNGRCNDTFDAMRHRIQEQVQSDNVNAMRTIKSDVLQEVRCGCDTQLAALEQTHHEFSIQTFDSLRGRIQEQIQKELNGRCNDTFDAMRHSIQEQVQNDNANAMRTIKNEVLQEVRCACETQLAAVEQTHQIFSIESIQDEIQNESKRRIKALDAMRDCIQEQVRHDMANVIGEYHTHCEQKVQNLENCVRCQGSKLREFVEALEQQGCSLLLDDTISKPKPNSEWSCSDAVRCELVSLKDVRDCDHGADPIHVVDRVADCVHPMKCAFVPPPGSGLAAPPPCSSAPLNQGAGSFSAPLITNRANVSTTPSRHLAAISAETGAGAQTSVVWVPKQVDPSRNGQGAALPFAYTARPRPASRNPSPSVAMIGPTRYPSRP